MSTALIETPPLSPVTPCEPLAPYVGGKRALAGRLCAMIEAIPHQLYAEPFVGMGGVYFRRRRRPRAEVINDISGDVAGLFRVLREHHSAFLDVLRYQIASRADFDRLLAIDPDHLTDLQRAARFLVLQSLAFGGRVEGRSFGAQSDSARFDLGRLRRRIAAAADRLEGVTIERLPFDRLIARYDRAEALFYIDPPYFRTRVGYGSDFALEDYGRLADQLAGIKGQFLMTLDDSPEIREIFGRFEPWPVPVTYSVARTTPKPTTELIISSVPRDQLEAAIAA